MLANILLVLSMIALIFGTVGINRLKGVIPKLLTSSLIDTMAMILLVIALMLKSGFGIISVKLGIVLIFVVLTNPVINHVITKATYKERHDD